MAAKKPLIGFIPLEVREALICDFASIVAAFSGK